MEIAHVFLSKYIYFCLQIRDSFLVNSVGPVLVSRYCLPLLSLGGGRIVNMISISPEWPLPNLSIYTSTKAALMVLSDTMRPEVAKYGVDLVMVNPGSQPMGTPLLCSGQKENYEKIETVSYTHLTLPTNREV